MAQHSVLGNRYSVLRGLLPALVTGGLLWLCHFPVAWGWLGWVALVPLLSLVRSRARPWRVYLSAWLSGLAFFVPVLQWMRVADDRMYFTWIALALYCALFIPLGVWLVRRLDRGTGLPLVLLVPVVWCALDYFRATFLGGFSWYFLAHTQHAFLSVIQIADLGGIYAVTFLVAAVNALVFEWLCALPAFRRLFDLSEGPRPPRFATLALHTAVVGLLMAADLCYGTWRLGQDAFGNGPRVALVQGNVPQSVRNATSGGSENAATQMFNHYNVLSQLAANQDPQLDLVVWPETCFPDYWSEVSPVLAPKRVPPEWNERVTASQTMASNAPKLWPTNVLLGMDSEVLEADGRKHLYNSAVFIRDNHGTGVFDGRYDKMHLVPFGEYVPLRDWLPLMNWLSPYDFDYSVTPGEHWTRFALGDYHFGAVICYEDSDPSLARQYVRHGSGPPVDFLVNISNDGWFNGTSEHEEHLAVARFRAIECRRALLRAVNMGISAVIDPNGRVLEPAAHVVTANIPRGDKDEKREIPVWTVAAEGGRVRELPTSRWGEFKKVYGVLTAVVPIDHRPSLYAAWGDWLPALCWVVVGMGLIWSVRGVWLNRQLHDKGVAR
jgi:apolipoprotein N-acyltransferase